MTRINPDDPKWTAYVLGELNETERAALERELEASEEAQAQNVTHTTRRRASFVCGIRILRLELPERSVQNVLHLGARR